MAGGNKALAMAVAALLLLVLVPSVPGAPDGKWGRNPADFGKDEISKNPLEKYIEASGGRPPIDGASPAAGLNTYNSTMEIENMTMAIDEGSVLRHLEKLVALKTRYSYSPQSYVAAEYIRGIFQSCGLVVQYHDFVTGATEMKNVIATLEGTNASAPAYYLGAHYDSASTSSYSDAPGADDDGTGTAAVLAAAEVLSHYRFDRTIVFCAFAGEEQGLIGSKAYAKMLYQSNTSVGGAICLDMVGYNPAPGSRDVLSRTNSASLPLANFTHNVSLKYPSIVVNCSVKVDPATNSDHAAFWSYGWRAVNFIEKKYATNPNYHQPSDTIGSLNMTYAANSTQLAIACVAELAGLASRDTAGPAFQLPFPLPGGYANETPTISLNALDPSSIATPSIQMYLGGLPVVYSSTPISGGYNITFKPSVTWADGQVIGCHIVANDTLGNTAHRWWNFTVDAVAPEAPIMGSIELMRVRADKVGVVLDLGPPGSYDDYYATSPSVMRDEGILKMWYAAYDGSTYQIAYATSMNGTNWTRRGIVLSTGLAGEPDSRHVGDCSVVRAGAAYIMWYSGHNGTTYRIMRATSPDGVNWTKQGMSLNLGTAGSLDDRIAMNPEVLRVGAEYWMYYTGSDGLTYRLLRAVSADGVNWTRTGLAVGTGKAGSMDSIYSYGPAVVYTGTGFLCWYTGFDGLRHRTLKAQSSDGISWTKLGMAMDVGTTGNFDTLAVAHPAAIIEDGATKIWYGGSNGNYRIMCALSSESGPGTKNESVVIRWPAVAGEVSGYEIYAATTWADALAPPANGWLEAQDRIFVHNGMGAGNASTQYYVLRSVDRVRHTTTHWLRAIKAGAPAAAGWSALGHVDPGMTDLRMAFESLSWTSVMAWNSTDAANHWRTNFTVRPAYMNDLSSLWGMAGCWVRTSNASAFVSIGLVRNVTSQLQPGWNFVSYPHAATKTAAEIMMEIGTACTSIEGFDPSATYKLKVLSGTDQMVPGRAYWIYLTASAMWNVQNY
jgi:predicted GH43/DUF377 family glycosyl hydrolase